MIHDNIDRGMYDLSNDRSGIRVGNEQYPVNKPEGQGGTQGTTTNGQFGGGLKIGQRTKEGGGGLGCCG